MINTIVLDLDEVLADFVGEACRWWGVDPDAVLQHWVPETFDIVGPLGAALGRGPDSADPFTPEEFWRKLNCVQFWAELPQLPWFDGVVTMMHRTVGWNRVHIYTSPTRCTTCHVGKIQWLRARFGDGFDRFAITPHKELAAKPGVLLIDDREETCRKFIAAGGDAVLFPRHHNGNHWFKADPVEFLKKQLNVREFVRLRPGTDPAV